YLLDKALFAGSEIAGARLQRPDPGNNVFNWGVLIELTSTGQRIWSDYTLKHNAKVTPDAGNMVAFLLDDRVVTAPAIQDSITGPIQISGAFTQQSATALTEVLSHGALPVVLTEATKSTPGAVPPTGTPRIPTAPGTPATPSTPTAIATRTFPKSRTAPTYTTGPCHYAETTQTLSSPYTEDVGLPPDPATRRPHATTFTLHT